MHGLVHMRMLVHEAVGRPRSGAECLCIAYLPSSGPPLIMQCAQVLIKCMRCLSKDAPVSASTVSVQRRKRPQTL